MRENLNLLCNFLMALSLVVLLIVGFALFLVVGFEMCYKLVDILANINHLFWWLIFGSILTFTIALLITIVITKNSRL
jgi:hypothetical protein